MQCLIGAAKPTRSRNQGVDFGGVSCWQLWGRIYGSRNWEGRLMGYNAGMVGGWVPIRHSLEGTLGAPVLSWGAVALAIGVPTLVNVRG